MQVLLTSSGRVRIGSLGLADSLAAPPSSRDELQQQQREDLAVRAQQQCTALHRVWGPCTAACPLLTTCLKRRAALPPMAACSKWQRSRLDICLCLQALGLLLLTLTCVGSGLRPSLDNCMANFSMDLTRIISALLSSPEGGSMTDSWCRHTNDLLARGSWAHATELQQTLNSPVR